VDVTSADRKNNEAARCNA